MTSTTRLADLTDQRAPIIHRYASTRQQTETLAAHWMHSPHYRSYAAGSHFRQGPETIEYVATRERLLQGQVIAPTRGVSDCYDMDDFNRPDVGPGSALVKKVMKDGKPAGTDSSGKGVFKFASGTLAALSGKVFKFSSKPTGVLRFDLEFTD